MSHPPPPLLNSKPHVPLASLRVATSSKRSFLSYHILTLLLLFSIVLLATQIYGRSLSHGLIISSMRILLILPLFFIFKHHLQPRLRENPPSTLALWIAVLALFMALMQMVVQHCVHVILDNSPWNYFRDHYGYTTVFWWMVFICGILLYIWILQLHSSHTQELQDVEELRHARETELHHLRSYFNPHFLFNALNTVAAEADHRPSNVQQIVLALSEYLRFSLHPYQPQTTLGTELNAVQCQLTIDKFRFEEKIEFEISASAEARCAQTPNPLLLPIVENALRHGMRTSEPPLHITINAEIVGEQLHVQVSNTGYWLPESQPRPQASGLTRLRHNLHRLYGNRHQLTIDTHHPSLVKVCIILPLLSL